MVTDVEAYPETNVQLEIVEVTFSGSGINEDEHGTFRVKVTNTGPLVLTDVTLRIKGQNGALVANNGAAAPFVSHFVTQALPTIGAHNDSQLTVGSPLKFQAPPEAAASQDLIQATLEDWNGSLDHIMNAHSDDQYGTAEATFAAEVFPK
jgi:hypothetical protein